MLIKKNICYYFILKFSKCLKLILSSLINWISMQFWIKHRVSLGFMSTNRVLNKGSLIIYPMKSKN